MIMCGLRLRYGIYYTHCVPAAYVTEIKTVLDWFRGFSPTKKVPPSRAFLQE